MSVLPVNTNDPYCLATFFPSKINFSYHRINGKRRNKLRFDWQQNFKIKKNDQSLSSASRRKIFNSIDWLLYLSDPQKIYNFKTKSYFSFKCSFFTATLSSPQVHSDNQIKRDILRPFIDWLRKNYQLEHYIWRLEKQSNGSTHFHMIMNRYVHWAVLRRQWNYFQEKLGYVSRYSRAQFAYHANGFTPRPDLFKSWPLERQREAYIQGCESGYTNPNSTDVHSLYKIKNVYAYICKYITKNDKHAQTPETISVQANDDLLNDSGRIWAVSESLSSIRPGCAIVDTLLDKEFYAIMQSKKARLYKGEHYEVLYLTSGLLQQLNCIHLLSVFQSFTACFN
jgi:hypothetical protein